MVNARVDSMEESTQPSRKENLIQEGIFEIAIVGSGLVAIALVFFLLNYFNVLRLDKAFPFLSVLPHFGQATPGQIITNIQPTRIPDKTVSNNPVTNPTPKEDTFTYDQQKAKEILNAYVAEIVNPQYIPAPLPFEQDFLMNKGIKVGANSFRSQWNQDGHTFTALFTYDLGTNNPSRLILDMDTGLLVNNTNDLQDKMPQKTYLDKYFKSNSTNNNNYQCNIDSQHNFGYCEIKSNVSNLLNKIGGYVLPQTDASKDIMQIFACRLYNGQKTFSDNKCVAFGL